jgi:ketosteroid isomerase-like protein
MIRTRALLFAVLLPAAALLARQPAAPSPFAQAVDAEITTLEKQFVPLAEAMPADRFDFTPESLRIPDSELAGVRTFAAQVRHVAADNFAIWAPISGKPEPAGIDAPNGPAAMTSRAEILDFLQRSFAFSHEAARRLTSENALTLVEFRGRKVTQISLVALGLCHAMDHYGQMVEYLRLSGNVPPGSSPRAKGPTASDSPSADERSVRDAEARWVDALDNRDAAALRSLLDEDFVDVTWKGEVRNKSAAVAALESKDRPSTTQRLLDLRVRFAASDTAVVTGLNVVTGKAPDFTARVRFTDVFVKRAGSWTAFSAQETLEKAE